VDNSDAAASAAHTPDDKKREEVDDECSTFYEEEPCVAASSHGCIWQDEDLVCYRAASDSDAPASEAHTPDDEASEELHDECFTIYKQEDCLAASSHGCVWQEYDRLCYKPVDNSDATAIEEHTPEDEEWEEVDDECFKLYKPEDCVAASSHGCVWQEEDLVCYRRVAGSDAPASEAHTPDDGEREELDDECFTIYKEEECLAASSNGCVWQEEDRVCYRAAGKSDATTVHEHTPEDAEREELDDEDITLEQVEAPPEDDWCYVQAGVDKDECDALSSKCMFVEKVYSTIHTQPRESEDSVSSSGVVTLVVLLGIAAFV